MEQELLVRLQHLISTRVLHCAARVVQSLAFCVILIYHCLSFCPLSSGRCIVSPPIYIFWLNCWYLRKFFYCYHDYAFNRIMNRKLEQSLWIISQFRPHSHIWTKTFHDIWRWKSKSRLGKGTHIWWVKPVNGTPALATFFVSAFILHFNWNLNTLIKFHYNW